MKIFTTLFATGLFFLFSLSASAQGVDTLALVEKSKPSPVEKERYLNMLRHPSHQAPIKQARAMSPLAITSSNIGFEMGDFSTWTGFIGYNTGSAVPLTMSAAGISTLGTNSAETTCSYHTLVNTGTDPYSGLPMVDPLTGGGHYSARLGGENENVNNPAGACTPADPTTSDTYSSGEVLQTTFNVTSATCMLTANYAIVMDASPHSVGQNPYFTAEILDQAGNVVPCGQYFIESSSNVPFGFFVSAKQDANAGTVFYSPWMSTVFNLKPYIGQNITLRFSAAGCTLSSHFAYAYIDCSVSPLQLTVNSPEVCQGGTYTATAPAGPGYTYTWQTMPSGTAGIVGSTNSQSVTIGAAGTYQVTANSPGACGFVIDSTFAFYPNPVLTVSSTNASCSTCSDGTATATVTAGNTPYSYNWNPPPGAGQGTPQILVLPPGTYTCCVTTANGCLSCATVTVGFSTSIVSNALSDYFKISPNPFGNTLRIEATQKEGELHLYNILGEELLVQRVNSGITELNTAALPGGVYFIKLEDRGKVWTYKLMRE
jgi:hypothetical protein